jgi:histidine triad (HIT) family protein
VLVPDGPVGEDELVMVSHAGLFVEPRRHAPGLADLTDAEARAVGWWCMRASWALREAAGADAENVSASYLTGVNFVRF